MQLIADRVTVVIADRVVLDEVDLTIETGELCALMGPSGSGKTTMLSVLSGSRTPSSGVVRVAGTSINACRAEQVVAWVPQGSNALGARTVRDNAMIGALARGCSIRDASVAAESILKDVGLGARMKDSAANLSGGELQRLAIARAVGADKSFLLADEPTGNLDRATAKDVMRVLRELTSKGKGILMATHDPFVAELCDHVLDLSSRK